jgi:hypothetical protein
LRQATLLGRSKSCYNAARKFSSTSWLAAFVPGMHMDAALESRLWVVKTHGAEEA